MSEEKDYIRGTKSALEAADANGAVALRMMNERDAALDQVKKLQAQLAEAQAAKREPMKLHSNCRWAQAPCQNEWACGDAAGCPYWEADQ
jgi:hypothetical protein